MTVAAAEGAPEPPAETSSDDEDVPGFEDSGSEAPLVPIGMDAVIDRSRERRSTGYCSSKRCAGIVATLLIGWSMHALVGERQGGIFNGPASKTSSPTHSTLTNKLHAHVKNVAAKIIRPSTMASSTSSNLRATQYAEHHWRQIESKTSPLRHRDEALATLQAFGAGRWIPPTCARSLLAEEQARIDGGAMLGEAAAGNETYARALVSPLGHQGGCPERTPTALRQWRPRQSGAMPGDAKSSDTCARASETSNAYSSLALVRALYGRTTCFVGDSVTLQLYDGMKHNLERLAMLRPELGVGVRASSARDLPAVNQTDCCGRKRGWWGGLKSVEGFVVEETAARAENKTKRANPQKTPALETTRVRYYKHYVWSPWDAELIATNCDVVLYNIGLHYSASDPKHMGRNGHRYATDERGAMAWLANFSATPGKLAVWRETLPQHFRTPDGMYSLGDIKPEPGCVPSPLERQARLDLRQLYNNVTASTWESLCPTTDHETQHRCALAPIAEMDERGALGESLLQWWRTNNYTVQLSEWERQSTANAARDPHREESDVVGVVWKWPLFHLFDQAWEYHASPQDCTHYCYVPELFNAALESLRLVLDLADADTWTL